ncbi:MAG: hypothetical protein AVDCRST_MAG05-1370 [uncultured Rubrobacteraceae bacterium]|uniref:P/Homo B domain-containing protein n=1 Tax=uncultured Rubrobacteraceae bacterium TaxID=349277 RepID=A0A6J4RV25_9ACTN|nr:MAG: hypothetical protein AVDCRST_MAG05-1370 [uncultured Rubrobacteraceae bacterium]
MRSPLTSLDTGDVVAARGGGRSRPGPPRRRSGHGEDGEAKAGADRHGAGVGLGGGATTPYPSEISVAGLREGKVLDANLMLKGFSHKYPYEADVMASHGTRSRTVMSDTGNNIGVNNITLGLDDEAASPLPPGAGTALTTGTFKPTNASDGYGSDAFPAPAPPANAAPELPGFDGAKANGRWQLWVADDEDVDRGEFIGGWSVEIKARVLR